jgi:hypothetical protein
MKYYRVGCIKFDGNLMVKVRDKDKRVAIVGRSEVNFKR